MRNLTVSDRSSLLRLASSFEPGSAERRAILACLSEAPVLTKEGSNDEIYRVQRIHGAIKQHLEACFPLFEQLVEAIAGLPSSPEKRECKKDLEKTCQDTVSDVKDFWDMLKNS